VTLTNPLGSVQLEIVDRESPTEPDTFQFVVTSATGPYTNLQGTGGVLELAVHGEAGAGTFHMDVNPIIPMAT
jgi:hypothetical protein